MIRTTLIINHNTDNKCIHFRVRLNFVLSGIRAVHKGQQGPKYLFPISDWLVGWITDISQNSGSHTVESELRPDSKTFIPFYLTAPASIDKQLVWEWRHNTEWADSNWTIENFGVFYTCTLWALGPWLDSQTVQWKHIHCEFCLLMLKKTDSYSISWNKTTTFLKPCSVCLAVASIEHEKEMYKKYEMNCVNN